MPSPGTVSSALLVINTMARLVIIWVSKSSSWTPSPADSHCIPALRQSIVDYLAEHKESYMFFVDDPLLEPEDAWNKHITNMRQNGVYGSRESLFFAARSPGSSNV